MKPKIFKLQSYFILYLLEAVVLHFIFPIVQLVHPPYIFIGIIPVVAGTVIHIWSDAIFKRRGTNAKPFEMPSELIMEGPFAYSRNPMYIGMVMSLLGLSMLLGSLAAFLAPITMFITLNIVFIPFEEIVLEKTFGRKYKAYKNRVRRWL